MLGQVRVFLDDKHFYRLSRFLVGHANHRAFHDAGAARHHVLNFARIDVETGDEHHVFFAINNLHIATLVHHANVAGLEIAIDTEYIGRFIGPLPIARHDLWPLDANLSGVPHLDHVIVVVPDRNVGRRQGHADGAGIGIRVGWVAGRGRRGFR